MFNFFGKKFGDAPPDVGQEEAYEQKANKNKKKVKAKDSSDEDDDFDSSENMKNFSKKSPIRFSGAIDESAKLQLERINAKIEANEALLKGFSERFSSISEQIGEVRAMTLDNEKELVKSTRGSSRAIDILKEVRPDKLRLDYQRNGMKITALSEKFEALRQYSEAIMNELKELRRKAGIFIGTDALLRLNEETKKEMIEIQKLGSRVRADTDKSEQIFIDLREAMSGKQKTDEILEDLNSSYSGLRKEVEKLRLDYSNFIKQSDFSDFKKTINNKLGMSENYFKKIDQLEAENERLAKIIETTLSISKTNKEDIGDMAMTIGDDNIKKVSDYDNKLASILQIVDGLAGQISEIKKRVGMSSAKKIPVPVQPANNENMIKKDKFVMQNVNVQQQKQPMTIEGKDADLKKRIVALKENKEKLMDYLAELKKNYSDGKISYSVYMNALSKKKDGKTVPEWIHYYEDYISRYSGV